MQFDHFNISAPEAVIESVKDFYSDLFAMEVGKRPDFNKHGYWLYKDDRPILHLTISHQHFEQDKPGYLDHIAFRMTGLELFIERLKARGIEFQQNFLADIGITQIFFYDPAGNQLEANFA